MYSNANSADVSAIHNPWNKGQLIGPKPPLKLREIWAIRIRLQLAKRARDLALFNLAIDSKLRGCDLVKLPRYVMSLIAVGSFHGPPSCSRRRDSRSSSS